MDMPARIDPSQLMLVLDTCLRALGSKLLSLIALAMAFVLACWAMLCGTWPAMAVAGGFVAGVVWPVLFVGWRKTDTE